jgi:hypothetical protein
MHEGAFASVRLEGDMSEPFVMQRGLKQGSCIAPLLFNVFFGAIIAESRKRFGPLAGIALHQRVAAGPKLGEFRVSEVLFADDAELLATSSEGLQSMLNIFSKVCRMFGQTISASKTKVLIVGGIVKPCIEVFTVEGVNIELVEEFKSLGTMQSSDGSIACELTKRSARMCYAFATRRTSFFCNPRVALIHKLRIFEALVTHSAIWVPNMGRY